MITLTQGECLDVMLDMTMASIDAIVTDPPYGLAFMDKDWDHGVPGEAYWIEAWRLAKPGAHLVGFGGTRTFHRLTCAIEDAGWEIRDCLSWLYGSGFPKSHNGSWGGTALKPGWEPIILARKPLSGTVSSNVTEHGTGALNIDGCRIAGPKGSGVWGSSNKTVDPERTFVASPDAADYRTERHDAGRWPANVVLDEEAAALLDDQSGELTSGANPSKRGNNKFATTYGDFQGQRECTPARGQDTGGASRFFYCAKASRAERERGLDGQDPKAKHWSAGTQSPGTFQSEGTDRTSTNHHPTVKPLSLMRWLCRLITPPGGLILDPFAGSGSTGCAAILEGFRFHGIERKAEYVEIARRRMSACAEQPSLWSVA